MLEDDLNNEQNYIYQQAGLIGALSMIDEIMNIILIAKKEVMLDMDETTIKEYRENRLSFKTQPLEDIE